MESMEQSVVKAMDGIDAQIFPFLPYILQDLWEIGSDPEEVIGLIKSHSVDYTSIRMLDLGCGKGAVSIKVASALGCHCVGIDGIGEFIEFAKRKAEEFGVSSLCMFKTDDIRLAVKKLTGFDIIFLGSIGPVFGDYYQTLTTLSDCLKPNGFFIISDAYIDDASNFSPPLLQKRSSIMEQITEAGMKLIDEITGDLDEIKSMSDDMFPRIKRRCQELIERYPENKKLFEDYIKEQEKENEILENKIICSTMVISRMVNP